MHRAIVTGADGFLGRHLVPVLEQHGVLVTALTRRPRAGASNIAMGDAPWSPLRLAKIIEAASPHVVFHLLGRASGSAAELERANVAATRSVIEALRYVDARPLLVCCGSAAEYGAAIFVGMPVCESSTCAPVTPYGVSKLAQTLTVVDFAVETGTPAIIARIFNPIGPGMPPHLALGDFARQLAALSDRGALRTGDIDIYRDFLDVRHVAEALWKLAMNDAARGIVNICSGQATKLRWLVELLIQMSGKNITIQPEAARMRSGQPKTVIGSTALLGSLGAAVPPTDYLATMARMWTDVSGRGAVAS